MALTRGTPFSLSSLSFHLNPRFPPPSSRPISSTTACFSTPISVSFDARTGITNKNTSLSSSKVLLKGMEYCELEPRTLTCILYDGSQLWGLTTQIHVRTGPSEMGSGTWLQAGAGFDAMEASVWEQHLGSL